ncbi:MAG: hypothetical protein WCJ95_15285 [Mariniphaga sp.]
MTSLKHIIFKQIGIALFIFLVCISCSKDQNSFLPSVRVNIPISFANYNFLTIPGNSAVFENQGVKGVILVCVDPGTSQYFAYDACCPNEKDYSGTVVVQPVKNLVSPPYTIFSSDFFGICNICGSKFNLMGGGQPVKGPATHYLQSYHVITGFDSLTITN